MSFLLSHLAQVIIVFLALGLLTAIVNYLSIQSFDQYPLAMKFPRVSILVPARNEAGNIRACVQSLLSQNYFDFEILVLDDHSTDQTRDILLELANSNPRLRLLEGLPLPMGWLGKHWACHQLAQAADGNLLLFTDADTQHSPNMLRDSVSALLAERADLVTAFPKEEVRSWGEKLIVPVISFGIFSFLPIPLVRYLRWPGLSVTIGQFMLFRREAYDAVGGYESVREHLVDDVMLGRRILAGDMEWRLLNGTSHISCRMYRDFWQVVDGFSKNVFAFFDYRALLYLGAWLWVATVFLLPFSALYYHAVEMPLEFFPYNLAVIAVGESLLLWSIAYRRFKFPAILVLFYPVSIFLFTLIALRSMIITLTGHATWKDRPLERSLFRW